MARISPPSGDFFIDQYEYPNRRGEKPKHDVIFAEARQLCAAQGKRLCTDWEWRRACMGAKQQNIFPYGPTHKDGACPSGSHLASGHSGMTREAEAIAKSGAHPGCKTSEQVYDMVGNLEEWVLTSWNGMPGILEGGAWFTIPRYASCTGDYSRQPQYRINLEVAVFSAGFRCCWSAAAPTEAALPKENLARDTEQRLKAARTRASKKPYDPVPEETIAPGTFIDRYEYPNRKGAYPMVAVSWKQADDLCTKAGKRLCHVEEWERACASKRWLNYPYGDEYQPGTCAVEAGAPSPAGAHPACASTEGVQDMSGGIWEWTADKMDVSEKLYFRGKSLRHVRGGSWYVDSRDATCRPEVGYPTAPEYTIFTDLGFRCCRGKIFKEKPTPTPATATCRADMVPIKDFCVDRYEFPNIKGEPPLQEVNLHDARVACKTVGRHVCTKEEWLLACAGTNRRTWPYGFSYDAKVCHSGLTPSDDTEVVVSGSMERCRTPEGIYDLSGNTWEWTEDGDGKGTLRGGGSNISAGFARCNSKAQAGASFHNLETGVRCCATQQEANALIARGEPPSRKQIMAALTNKLNPLVPKNQVLRNMDRKLPSDAGPPDLQQPDLRSPDLLQPDLQSPDLLLPDLRRPDLRQPDPRPMTPKPATDMSGPSDPGAVRVSPPPSQPARQPDNGEAIRANVQSCTLAKPRCPSGQICCFDKKVCCMAPLDCSSSAECSQSEHCYLPHRRCYKICPRNGVCTPPFTCDPVQKVCHPPGPTCADSDECPEGIRCHPHYYYCMGRAP